MARATKESLQDDCAAASKGDHVVSTLRDFFCHNPYFHLSFVFVLNEFNFF
jgi:hypothetical protein